jgi:hypothetical protein
MMMRVMMMMVMMRMLMMMMMMMMMRMMMMRRRMMSVPCGLPPVSGSALCSACRRWCSACGHLDAGDDLESQSTR